MSDLELYNATDDIRFLYPKRSPIEIYGKSKSVYAWGEIEKWHEQLWYELQDPHLPSVIKKVKERQYIECNGFIEKKNSRYKYLVKKGREESKKGLKGTHSHNCLQYEYGVELDYQPIDQGNYKI